MDNMVEYHQDVFHVGLARWATSDGNDLMRHGTQAQVQLFFFPSSGYGFMIGIIPYLRISGYDQENLEMSHKQPRTKKHPLIKYVTSLGKSELPN